MTLGSFSYRAFPGGKLAFPPPPSTDRFARRRPLSTTSPPFRAALLRHLKTAFKRHEDDILTTRSEDVAQERLLEPNLADLGAS